MLHSISYRCCIPLAIDVDFCYAIYTLIGLNFYSQLIQSHLYIAQLHSDGYAWTDIDQYWHAGLQALYHPRKIQLRHCGPLYRKSQYRAGVGGKSVCQDDVFPRKFDPVVPDRIYYPPPSRKYVCPGLGEKSVRQENVSELDSILDLHSYKSLYEPGPLITCKRPCRGVTLTVHTCTQLYVCSYVPTTVYR